MNIRPGQRDHAHRYVDVLGRRTPYPGGRKLSPGVLTVSRFVNGEQLDTIDPARRDSQTAVDEALLFADAAPDHLVVLGYDLPTAEQLAQLATAWELHPLLVEDLIKAGQRPKLERYGDVLFVVTRAASYVDATEEVVFGEFHVLARGNVVVVMCQDRQGELPWEGQSIPRDPELLRLGSEAVVYSIIDSVVDGYFPVTRGLDIDREQIERQVFGGEAGVTERIYRLSQEVIDLQHAVVPLGTVLAGLRAGFGKYGIPEELQTYLQDVHDHLARVHTSVVELKDSLNQILNVNSTLVTQRQNEDMKKISGWAAILFAPTLIGAIYGMNFDEMPELHWTFGYPLAVGAMLGLGALLWVVFKKKNWM